MGSPIGVTPLYAWLELSIKLEEGEGWGGEIVTSIKITETY